MLSLDKLFMSDKDQKKSEIPQRMKRIAWPKAKYGLYIAIFIIVMVLLILYGDLIL